VKELIEKSIKNYIREYSLSQKLASAWSIPIVKFADANDPLFLKLKSIIGKTHNSPQELLEHAKTVITYFIPFDESIVLSNIGGVYSSRDWAIAYVETNHLIEDLNKHISQTLNYEGFKTKILPPTHNFDENKLISDWSHKHVGYIAGLGKFGVHKMLITEKGCCGRIGSLITDAAFTPSKREDNEFCLHYHDKSCLKCVNNCSFGALKKKSLNRHKCYEICLLNSKYYTDLGLVDVCGKCCCIVPCSFRNPVP